MIIEPARCILTHDLWSIIIIELPLVPLFVDWRRQAVPSPIDGYPVLAVHLVLRNSISSRLLHVRSLGCYNRFIFRVWSGAPVIPSS